MRVQDRRRAADSTADEWSKPAFLRTLNYQIRQKRGIDQTPVRFDCPGDRADFVVGDAAFQLRRQPIGDLVASGDPKLKTRLKPHLGPGHRAVKLAQTGLLRESRADTARQIKPGNLAK